MKPCSRRTLYLLVISLLIFLSIHPLHAFPLQPPNQTGTVNEDLFTDTLFDGDRHRFNLLGVKQTRFVKINTNQFKTNSQLSLNLLDDVFFQARLNRRGSVKNIKIWTGTLDNIPQSQAIFAFHNNIVSATISTPQAFYRVRYAGNGIHALQQLDHSRFPSCAVAASNTDLNVKNNTRYNHGINGGLTLSPEIGPVLIDVMVVYTEAARLGAGGTDAMATTIALAVAETNIGYAQSVSCTVCTWYTLKK